MDTSVKKPGNNSPLRHYKIYTLLLHSDLLGFDHHGPKYIVDMPDAARSLSIKTAQLRETLSYMQAYGLIENLGDYGSRRCRFTLILPDISRFGV